MTKELWPMCTTNCADCGIGTITLGEWYMVHDDIWERAWAGRRKPWHGKVPGTEILCIGCLEQRLGRTLLWCDFTNVPINDPANPSISERLRERMTADSGHRDGELPCFKCDHPDAWKVRKQIIDVVSAVIDGGALPPRPDVGGDLPADCCRRKPRLVEA